MTKTELLEQIDYMRNEIEWEHPIIAAAALDEFERMVVSVVKDQKEPKEKESTFTYDIEFWDEDRIETIHSTGYVRAKNFAIAQNKVMDYFVTNYDMINSLKIESLLEGGDEVIPVFEEPV